MLRRLWKHLKRFAKSNWRPALAGAAGAILAMPITVVLRTPDLRQYFDWKFETARATWIGGGGMATFAFVWWRSFHLETLKSRLSFQSEARKMAAKETFTYCKEIAALFNRIGRPELRAELPEAESDRIADTAVELLGKLNDNPLLLNRSTVEGGRSTGIIFEQSGVGSLQL